MTEIFCLVWGASLHYERDANWESYVDMKLRKHLALGLFVGMAAGITGAGGAWAQTLEEALSATYNSNPTLNSQRAALRATDEGVPQALSGWRPTVTVTGTYEREYSYQTTRTGKRQAIRSPYGASLTFTQNLYAGGSTEALTSQAENTVLATRAETVAVEQNILLDAATAYLDVYRDQAVLELNINNEQVLKRQLEATRDRFEVGELTRTDVSQAEARLAGSTADRIQSEGNLEASRAGYKNIIGHMPKELAEPKMLGDIPTSEEEAIKVALDVHPNVVAATYTELAALDNVDNVRAQLLPSLDLSGTMSRNFETLSNTSRADEASIKATLSVPIYQAGEVYSEVRESKQLAAQDRVDLEFAKRRAIELATRSWEALTTARARIRSYKSQIKAAEVALEGVQREAQVGSRTVLDVLDAEQELLDAKVSLVRAERDELLAVFQVQEATGRLTAKDLGLAVKVYNMNDHYNEVRDSWFGGSSSGDIDDTNGEGKSSEQNNQN